MDTDLHRLKSYQSGRVRNVATEWVWREVLRAAMAPLLLDSCPLFPSALLFPECCFAEKICSRGDFQKLINACSAGSLKSG